MSTFQVFNHVEERYEAKLKDSLEESIIELLIGKESDYSQVEMPSTDGGDGSTKTPTYEEIKEDIQPKANILANYMHNYVYEMINASIKGHLSSYHNYQHDQNLSSEALGSSVDAHYVGVVEEQEDED